MEMIQDERLSDKLEVFLSEDYYFSMRMLGRKCQVIIKNGIMKFQDEDDIEYSQTKCDDITISVLITGQYKFILDVITVKGVSVSYMTLEKRLIMAQNFLCYNEDFDIVDLLTQEEMMEIYFEDQIFDFVSIHKQTGKRGIIGVTDIINYLYYIQRVEEEENRLVRLENERNKKIEETRENLTLSESSQNKEIERIEQTYDFFSNVEMPSLEFMTWKPEKPVKETVVAQEIRELEINYEKIAFTKESFEAREKMSEKDQVQKYHDVIDLEIYKRDRLLTCHLMNPSNGVYTSLEKEVPFQESVRDQGGGQSEKNTITKKPNFKKIRKKLIKKL